jgi:hypothetical protein
MKRGSGSLLLACVIYAAWVSTASASLLDVMVQDYVADQQLDACKYSPKQLQALKDLIPNDVKAYDAGFVPAVDDALAYRASGGCDTRRSRTLIAPVTPTTGEAQPPATPSRSVAPPSPREPRMAAPAPTPAAAPIAMPDVEAQREILIEAHRTAVATPAPFPLLLLAGLASLAIGCGVLLALARWGAWQPRWVDQMSHAVGEASWRAASTWAEFADFVRFGR